MEPNLWFNRRQLFLNNFTVQPLLLPRLLSVLKFLRGSLLVGLGGKAQQVPTNISLPDIPRFVLRCYGLFRDISRQEDRKVLIGSQSFFSLFLLGISSWSFQKLPTPNSLCKYTMVELSKHRPSGPMLSISRNVHMFVCLFVCLSVHFWGTV